MTFDNHRLIIFDKKNELGYFGRYNQCNVYRHNDSQYCPEFGEVWYCELEMKLCDYKSVYFAKLIERFELSSLSMFDQEDLKTLAGYIVQYHPDEARDILAASGRLVTDDNGDVEFGKDGHITYVGNDTLRSHRFRDGSYDIERSADGSCLLIQRRDCGRLLATDYKIKVGGLDSLLGGYVGRNLQFSEIDEGLLLKIGDTESVQTI